MIRVIIDAVLFSCMAAFITGVVLVSEFHQLVHWDKPASDWVKRFSLA